MPDIEKTRDYVKMVAEHRGWGLQPEKESFDSLVDGLSTNLDRFGYRSCPCRLASGKKENDRDIICPCEYAEPDIKEYGHCYCSLFYSKEYLAMGGKYRAIPERRPAKKMK